MKLSELKPCACCGGPLLSDGIGVWYVIRTSIALLNRQATRQVMGLNTMFKGAIKLAEAFAPDPEAVVIAGDVQPSMLTELHVCFDCLTEKMGMLCQVMEAAGEIPSAGSTKLAEVKSKSITNDQSPKTSDGLPSDVIGDVSSWESEGGKPA